MTEKLLEERPESIGRDKDPEDHITLFDLVVVAIFLFFVGIVGYLSYRIFTICVG